MSRATAPTIHCDNEECDNWTLDDYEMCVDTVNGERITSTHRAYRWVTVGNEDFCPEHRPTEESEA